TTALVKNAENNAKTGGGEGVIPGDSLAYTASYNGNDTRVDLVFRIQPGPGNYSVKGDRSSPLWKIPSDPGLGTASAGDNAFWGQYMKQTAEANGEVGSAQGHTAAAWDPQTWNSARMDSLQVVGIYPVPYFSIGNIATDYWQSTYIESDPKGGAKGGPGATPAPLAVAQNLCYVINLSGPVNQSNICCDPA